MAERKYVREEGKAVQSLSFHFFLTFTICWDGLTDNDLYVSRRAKNSVYLTIMKWFMQRNLERFLMKFVFSCSLNTGNSK